MRPAKLQSVRLGARHPLVSAQQLLSSVFPHPRRVNVGLTLQRPGHDYTLSEQTTALLSPLAEHFTLTPDGALGAFVSELRSQDAFVTPAGLIWPVTLQDGPRLLTVKTLTATAKPS